MQLVKFLMERKDQLEDKWYKAIIDTYPSDSTRFFIDIKDKFANPIGGTYKQETPIIIEKLLENSFDETLAKAIENVIKVRAIQDIPPSEAVGFLSLLKGVIGDATSKSNQKDWYYEELIQLNDRIDRLILIGFDKFVEIREKIYDIKASEKQHTYGKMVEKVMKKYDM